MSLFGKITSAGNVQFPASQTGRDRPGERAWSRRRFLGTAGTTAALTIVPRHVLGGSGYVPPSEKINIAVIGTGGQGIENIKQLLQEPDVQIIAIADPDEESDLSRFYYGGTGGRVPALKLIRESDSQKSAGTGKSCVEYIDFRQMLEKEKAIDAVLVATPDHVHAVATMAAIQLGKHVYCEKPLCHSIYEVRKIAEAARQAKVATQMGNQGHSGDGIRLTCEWLWDGAIGQVREVHSWAVVEPWTELKARPKETPRAPASLNWDLWLGPAPYRPYHPAYAPVTWRCWYDFGTGILGDFACHHLDPAFWGLKLGYPTSVEATSFGGSSETYPWASIVYYEFPARGEMPPVKLVWYDGGLAPETPEELEPGRKLSRNGHGILFVGDKGKMVCGGWGGTPRLIPESAMTAYKLPPKTIPRVEEHHRNWLDACKGGPPACANFEAIGPMVEVVLLGCISQRTGEKLYWDGPNMRCTNVAAANDYVRSPYREGWTL
jgi:predicted dehydrogenase